MTGIFERFSERQKYRLASIGLLGGSALPFLLPIMGLAWGWILLGFIVSMAFYTALVVLTYYRLRDAWLSGWWLLLMIRSGIWVTLSRSTPAASLRLSR
jgi:uncharacterized membrane protein YhaH (DUF805 family)